MVQLRHRDICYFYQWLPLYKSGTMKQNWKIWQELDFSKKGKLEKPWNIDERDAYANHRPNKLFTVINIV